jgi:hypothetical protein
MPVGLFVPAGAADDVSCKEPHGLVLEAQQPADQCEGSLDGISTRVVTNFTYTASMTGNGDSAPTFETFFDGEPSSCEPEYVSEWLAWDCWNMSVLETQQQQQQQQQVQSWIMLVSGCACLCWQLSLSGRA